jgi:hypothetical protein
MQKLILFIHIFVIILNGCNQDRYQLDLPRINAENFKFAPEYYSIEPGITSPVISEKNRELVIVEMNNGLYSWFDATVENGEPFDYKRNLYGKGNQLLADAEDFPGLARKGIHSEMDLCNTKIITGRSVSQTTIDGRPMGSSGTGFMAEDETIMSVIHADNQTVKKLQLTHPDIARPLFHLWNISREFEKFSTDTVTGEQHELAALVYNGKRVMIKITGSRGWQESIFNDEILGSGHIEIWRELNTKELEFLKKNYAHLSLDQFGKLRKMISYIHTGEMVFFYINRYGFYEGHTEYRVDPVAVVLIFGMRSIENVHKVCGGDLYGYFIKHFTQNPE